MITQLIIDVDGSPVQLPQSKAYAATKSLKSVDVEMITGRMTREVRGEVWEISYQYGYFSDEVKNAILTALEKGKRQPITCGFLTQESTGALTYSSFFVTGVSRPQMHHAKRKLIDGSLVEVPIWANLAFSLREVEPSD